MIGQAQAEDEAEREEGSPGADGEPSGGAVGVGTRVGVAGRIGPAGLDDVQQGQEKELLLGWNYKAPVIIKEFAYYVKDGSQIDIMLRDPGDEIRRTIETLDS